MRVFTTKGDKVVVFSQCLKTLDYIESVIKLPDWGSRIPGLKRFSKNGQTFGGWKIGRDYLRIDGSVSAFERGNLINQFNDQKKISTSSTAFIDKKSEERAKAFLISSRAGSVG